MRAVECHAWHGNTIPFTLQHASMPQPILCIARRVADFVDVFPRRLNAELEAKTAALVQEAEDLVVSVLSPLHFLFFPSSLLSSPFPPCFHTQSTFITRPKFIMHPKIRWDWREVFFLFCTNTVLRLKYKHASAIESDVELV